MIEVSQSSGKRSDSTPCWLSIPSCDNFIKASWIENEFGIGASDLCIRTFAALLSDAQNALQGPLITPIN